MSAIMLEVEQERHGIRWFSGTRRRGTLTGAATWAGLWLYILGLFAGVAAVLIASLGSQQFGGWIPKGFTFSFYHAAWEQYGIATLLRTTFEVAVLVVGISLLVGLPTGFVLARLKFPGRRLLFVLFLLPQVVPALTYAVPLATLIYKLHLNNTLLGVTIVNLVPTLPFAVLVLIPFIEQIDPRMEEAARVCGANTINVFRRILTPLLVPGLLAAGVLILVRVVGQFELTFLVAGPQSQTLVVALYQAATNAGLVQQQQIDAMSVIYMLTTLVLLVVSLAVVDPTSVVARQRRSDN